MGGCLSQENQAEKEQGGESFDMMPRSMSLTSDTYKSLSAAEKAELLEAFAVSPSVKSLKYLNIGVPSDRVVVIVDPLSTGFCLSERLQAYGVKQILVWSSVCPPEIRHLIPAGAKPIDYLATIDSNDKSMDELVRKIRLLSPLIHAVYIGCETEVELGESIATALNLPGNDGSKSYIRRHKFFQQQAARDAGVASTHQKLAKSMDDVEDFLKENDWDPFVAIVKPSAGAGTVGVVKCNSKDEVRKAAQDTLGTTNVFGVEMHDVLLQEFLQGNEYVVNSVTVGSEHKIVSLWAYDKRTYMGNDFVYFASRLMHPEEEIAVKLREYALTVLSAIGIENGCCHMEIIYTKRGPVLVETNCRPHGGEGAACRVAEMCIGYSQMTVYADAFLDPTYFAKIPAVYEIKRYGRLCYLRSPMSGVVVSRNHKVNDEIKALNSYHGEMIFKDKDDYTEQTKDAVTRPGMIFLVNESEEDLASDYKTFNELNDDFFEIKKEEQNLIE